MESEHFAKGPFFPNKTLQIVLSYLWNTNIDGHELDPVTGQSQNFKLLEFVNKYYKPYADIQYYTQFKLDKLFDTSSQATTNTNAEISTKNNIVKWLALMNHPQNCCGGISIETGKEFDIEVFVSCPTKLCQ